MKALRFATALLASLSSVSAVSSSARSDDTTTITTSLLSNHRTLQTETIAEIAAGNSDFSTLVSALELGGLLGAASNPDATLTVFAPLNEAFAALDEEFFALLVTPAYFLHLQNLLSYHVVLDAAVLSTDLANGQAVTMLNSEVLTVDIDDANGEISLLDSQGVASLVVGADVLATNGVVHAVDSVLLPTFVYRTLVDNISTTDSKYSTFFNLVELADLTLTLQNSILTVFAPVNAAFAGVPAGDVAFLTSPEGKDALVEILTYHIFPQVVTSEKLTNGATVETLQGNVVTITLEGVAIRINDAATVLEADILASNGVTHGIDALLSPVPNDTTTVAPTTAPTATVTTTLSTILELARADPELSTLVAAAEAASLDTVLDSANVILTVFAPTNTAFDALNQDLLTLLLTPAYVKHLENVLLYHTADGAVFSTDLSDGLLVSMLNQEEIQVNIDGAGVFLTNDNGVSSPVAVVDVQASNGVVHVIEAVLLPSLVFRTVAELDPADYSTLLSLITLAELGDTLAGGEWTLFAPTNSAFADVPQETVDFLTSPEGADTLTNILLFHVVPQVLTSDKLSDGATAETARGEPITVGVTGDVVTVNGATVIQADILASNGVAHGIDAVLMPRVESVAPTLSPASPTIAELAVATEELSTLVVALTTAELVEALNDPDAALTVFAPTNAGFADVPGEILIALLTPDFSQHLNNLLLYHVVSGVVPAGDLSDGQVVEMLNGETVTVGIDAQGVSLTDLAGLVTSVEAADVFASNGVVHIVGAVLRPSFFTRSVIGLGDSYSTVLSLIAAAELEETLSSGAWTFFAPVNDAFDAIPAETVAFLTSPEGLETLASILTYHVIPQVLTSDKLSDGATAETAQGGLVTIGIAGEVVTVNGATVVNADVLAINGVTHGIDAVLMPMDETNVPTLSPPTGGTTAPTLTPLLTIAELAVATPALSTLVTAATAAGLVETLNDPNATLTAFGPTNDAFDALPEGVLDRLLSPAFGQHLTNVLLYHVVGAVVLAGDLSDGQVVDTANGETVTVGIDATSVTLTNGAGVATPIVATDILASNGVVHILGGVLLPSFTARMVVDLGENYSTVLSLVSLANLEDTLRGGLWTFFAPINDAFDAFSAEQLTVLTSLEGLDSLTQILTYHVVDVVLTSDRLPAMTSPTAQGGTLMIGSDTDGATVNDASIVNPDILALNGVTHGIDKVLLPPAVTDAPTASPPLSAAPSMPLSAAPSMSASPTSSSAPSPAPTLPTIADIVIATDTLSTLEAAVTTAELVDALDDPTATLTVFAPTNFAFSLLPAGVLDALLTPAFSQHLTNVLLYHVVASVVLAGDLSNGQVVDMLNGETVTVGIDAQGVSLTNGAGVATPIQTTDTLAGNGVVHVIAGVLLPSFTARTVVDLSDNYSTVLSLVAMADLDATLRAGTWTFFAPNDTAFADVPAETVAFLTSPEGLETLTSILTYHVVPQVLTSDKLSDGATAETAQGSLVTIDIAGEVVIVNGATVVNADILALNGVTHGIDAVLIPPVPPIDPTPSPTITPGSPTSSPTSTPTVTPGEPTILDLAQSTESLSTLVTAVTTAGLDDTLDNPLGTLTVFAPTNDAFDALPDGVLTMLLTPAFGQHLTNLLLYHVVGTVALAADLMDGAIIETGNGEIVTVSIAEDAVSLINGANVATLVQLSDLTASNGVVHVISGVLLPSFVYRTIIELGATYSTLLAVVEIAGLTDTLKGGTWTLFAPTNTAFAKLPQETINLLTSVEGMDELVKVLTYHVVDVVLTSGMLTDGATATTLEGSAVTIDIMDGNVMVNDATVITPDVLAINGVTHGIDTVLMPTGNEDMGAPTMAPTPSSAVSAATSFTGIFVMMTILALAF